MNRRKLVRGDSKGECWNFRLRYDIEDQSNRKDQILLAWADGFGFHREDCGTTISLFGLVNLVVENRIQK